MANSYYAESGNPISITRGASVVIRNEYVLIRQGFDKLPAPSIISGSAQNYAVDTGLVNAVVCILNANISSYTDGLELIVKIAVTNTGATTITPGALTVKNIVRGDGTPLQTNDLLANEIVSLRYDVVNGNFQLMQISSVQLTAFQTNAAASAAAALNSATAAAASAVQAASAAATLTSTTTTSLTISIASKSFTTQPSKAYLAGYQFVTLISNANAANYMYGTVTSYNLTTGAMVVNVLAIGGGGTFTDFNVAVSGIQGPLGVSAATVRQPLTAGATINWDWSLGRIGFVTIAGAANAIAAPLNLVTDTCILEIIQDVTGSRTVSWNAIYVFPEGVVPTLSTVAGRRDIFTGFYNGTNIVLSQIRGAR